MDMLTRSITLISLVIILSGCQTSLTKEDSGSLPTTIDSAVAIAPHWQHKENPQSSQSFDAQTWLLQFNDERLNEFVATAISNNPDLRTSAANLAASIESAKATGAPLWPQFDARLARTRTQSEILTSGQTAYNSVYNASININWELDIWGKLSAQKKAAVLDAESQQANYTAARLALAANIARAWYGINTLQLRLELAEKRLQSQTDTLEVIEEKYKSGTRTALEVYLNRTDLASQKASIIDLRDQLQQSIRNFKQLLGKYPDQQLAFEAQLPELNTPVPAGLPSELLTRRPDVLASMKQWQSSKLSAKAADRARFPSFSLTASYGASSEKLRLLDQETLLWNLVNNLTLPLFRGGQLKAQARQAEFLSDASFNQYLSTLLTSFNEVETALSSENYLSKQTQAIEEAAYYSESGYQLAFEQYQSGLIEYTTLLESQRRWFDAQSNLINLKNTLLQNRIALYLALGGDF